MISQRNRRRVWDGLATLAAMGAGVLSVFLGLMTLLLCSNQNPFWPRLQQVSEIGAAPIPSGSEVVVFPPPEAKKEEWLFWLFEARWSRPDLLLAMPDEQPWSALAPVAVTIGGAQLEPEWTVVWHRGPVAVATRQPLKGVPK